MKFNPDLSSIHAYLCADGYVIRNLTHQKHKYYRVGLRNKNIILLKDFQIKCKKQFKIEAKITKDRANIHNKELYNLLTRKGSFYCREWKLPKLSKTNLQHWLRSFFDCESWVEVQKAKSRVIGLELTNEESISSISQALKKFNINSSLSITKKSLLRLTICGKDDLLKFQKYIGFLHPKKKQKLKDAIESYANYDWNIPNLEQSLVKFIQKQGKVTKSKNQIRLFSIKKGNMIKLKKVLNSFKIESKIHGPFTNQYGSVNYYISLYYKDYKNLGGLNGKKRNTERTKTSR